MKTTTRYWGIAGAGIAAFLAACAAQMGSQSAESGVSIGTSDLGGVVTSAKGPEAGVWVIAETRDLPTQFAKIVVTDDRGRYLIPDLPKARYSVWVRGYGLADSAKVQAAPGTSLNLNAVPAANAAAAAQNYPAIYWYSMLKVPQAGEFPLAKVKDQPEWLNVIKSGGCNACHAMGSPGTRTMPKDFTHMNSDRGVGKAHPVRAGHDTDGPRHQPARLPARAFTFRRLDRPDRRGRAAVCAAAAAAGHRAQRRPYLVGLEHAHGLYARFDRNRPAQPHPLPQWQVVWRDRGQHGLISRSSIR